MESQKKDKEKMTLIEDAQKWRELKGTDEGVNKCVVAICDGS